MHKSGGQPSPCHRACWTPSQMSNIPKWNNKIKIRIITNKGIPVSPLFPNKKGAPKNLNSDVQHLATQVHANEWFRRREAACRGKSLVTGDCLHRRAAAPRAPDLAWTRNTNVTWVFDTQLDIRFAAVVVGEIHFGRIEGITYLAL